MHVPSIEVRPEDELPVTIEGYDWACVGFGRQLTDSGVVRNVAIYSQSMIMHQMMSDALEFISAHNGEAITQDDMAAATDAAKERFDLLVKEWAGAGMPVFAMDLEENEDGQGTDGEEEPIEG